MSCLAPYLLQAVRNHHFKEKCRDHPLAQTILDAFYVDNIQGTVTSEEQLVEIYISTQQMLQEASMMLQLARNEVADNPELP